MRARRWIAVTLGVICAMGLISAAIVNSKPGAVPQRTQLNANTTPVHTFVATDDLNGRAGRSLNARTVKVDQYRKGQKVPVVCQDAGEFAYGSDIWDLTASGTWVTDVYVKTGSTGYAKGVPRCGSGTQAATQAYRTTTDLSGRTAKRLSATTKKVYKKGSSVTIKCQAYGQYAYGSYIWDKTSDSLWVTDKYLKTGHDGFIPGLTRCDSDPPSDGAGAGKSGGGRGSNNGTAGSSDCYSTAAVHGRNNGAAGSTSGTAAQRIERVVAAAKSMTTKKLSYSWGGGGKGGPACGVSYASPGGHLDFRVYGFDCSGLTLYAFWRAAGINIGDSTSQQYSRGTKVNWSSLRRGDLVFWGSGDNIYSTTHVALYLGKNQILEAAPPRGTTSVHVTTLYGSGRHTAHVIRFIK
ncbi:MAG: Cell wall-associated NlpC family hydrolase [Actinomycetia bacterium]|nr:Cell wall-associated NlpC family hydrolase [Actinomycetes bacterium]